MRSLVQLLAVIAAFSAGTAVRAQDEAQEWPRYYVGVAFGLKEETNQLEPKVSEAGGIPARIWGDRALELDGDRAWKLVGGFRPVRVVGAEIQYLHFGDGGTTLGPGNITIPRQYGRIEASSDAIVVSALLFIPKRVPTADIYGKIGIAALEEAFQVSGYDSIGPGCQPAIPNCAFDISVKDSDSVPYVGFGARLKISAAIGVRVELEAVDRDGGDPMTFLSVGIAWEH